MDTNRDNQQAEEHLAFALKMPEGRSDKNYIVLDNNLELGQVFNQLFYLFDEKAQNEIRESNGRKQPTCDLVFMKKRNHLLPIDEDGKPRQVLANAGVTPM